MKCDRECRLESEVHHARNVETRHLAEIGELAREIILLKSRIVEMQYEIEILKEALCSTGSENKPQTERLIG